MKKVSILKTIFIILFLMVFVSNFIITNVSFAEYTWDLERFDDQNDSDLDDKATTILGAIIGVMRVVGTGMALIMIIAVAIKYMYAAPSEKGDIKKAAMPFIVGAMVLFGATGILGIIQNFSTVFND